jgi:hypothetical protein
VKDLRVQQKAQEEDRGGQDAGEEEEVDRNAQGFEVVEQESKLLTNVAVEQD